MTKNERLVQLADEQKEFIKNLCKEKNLSFEELLNSVRHRVSSFYGGLITPMSYFFQIGAIFSNNN